MLRRRLGLRRKSDERQRRKREKRRLRH